MIDASLPRLLRPVLATSLAVLVSAMLSACSVTGVAIGAGAGVGVAAYEERGLAGAAKDLKITAGVLEKWIMFDHTLSTKVGVEVYEGRALLTGAVVDPKTRADAVRLAWEVPGVRDVLNEIQVSDTGAIDFARDSWITAQIKSKITFDSAISAINYEVETVNATVYLIGIAKNQSELDRVIGHARSISYVKQVISHVRVKESS
ncbi:MAG: BON domain-containing protein [Rhodospirillales bacterium]|nr:BON domain-containing protein [Rhodospirillales bacterium]